MEMKEEGKIHPAKSSSSQQLQEDMASPRAD